MSDAHLNKQIDKQLQQQIEQLPKEIQPSRDLWAGIDHAIENRSQKQAKQKWQKLTAVAAGFAIFGWLSWLTVNVGNSAFEPAINSGSDHSIAQQKDEALSFVDSMSESYEAQKQALLVQYDGQQSMVKDWQVQLEELDKAADAIKKALLADPSNAQLIKMLQQTYQQQLDLINMVNRSPWQQI